MAAPVWPANKGFALAEGFRETLGEGVRRSSVDAGPPKQRMTSGAEPDTFTGRYLLTTAERIWLVGFYKDPTAAARGGNWFLWTHPVLEQQVLARFVAGSPPTYEAFKPDWIASVTLEWRSS